MAAVLLVAGMPITSAISASQSSHPEITTNICWHPQTAGRVTGVLLARPAYHSAFFLLVDFGRAYVSTAARRMDHRVPPDTPPPKAVL
jgi:hypothetical protein